MSTAPNPSHDDVQASMAQKDNDHKAAAPGFHFLKFPYDVRCEIYKTMYPSKQTIYLTMGPQTVRRPSPVDYHLPSGWVNFIETCQLVRDEIYEILYETNTFVLSPNKPDLYFTSEGRPIVYRRHKWSRNKGNWGTGTVAGDGVWYVPTLRAIECFFNVMSPATCARLREIQLFVGQPFEAVPDLEHMPDFETSNFPLFPKVIVVIVPQLYSVIRTRLSETQYTIEYRSQIEYSHCRLYRRLKGCLAEIEKARAYSGTTIYDDLDVPMLLDGWIIQHGAGSEQLKDLENIVLPRKQGLLHHNFESNAKWWKDLNEKYLAEYGPNPILHRP
ncbi:MAG: hypothetical protein Q9174_006138 [Haloplaca sp. 1 TL-2023]